LSPPVNLIILVTLFIIATPSGLPHVIMK